MNDINVKLLGKKVTLQRSKLGWSLGKLQKESTINTITLQNIEKGILKPCEAQLNKLCKALNLNQAYLLGTDIKRECEN